MAKRPSATSIIGVGDSSKMDDETLAGVWVKFKAEGGELLRNRLLEHYLPLVRYHGQRVSARLPDEVDVDDLISAGTFGLMDAVESFDLARGIKFETYSSTRIRGAILDELRSMDWAPRLVRSRASKVDTIRRGLEMEFGRPATEDEIAAKLDVSPEDYTRIRRDAGVVGVVSLSRKWYQTDSDKDVCEIDVLEDPGQENPLTTMERLGLKDAIMRGMSRAERLILLLYYYEQMTMLEIGATLDLSESRVSQMHTSIMKRLKAQLTQNQDERSYAVA